MSKTLEIPFDPSDGSTTLSVWCGLLLPLNPFLWKMCQVSLETLYIPFIHWFSSYLPVMYAIVLFFVKILSWNLSLHLTFLHSLSPSLFFLCLMDYVCQRVASSLFKLIHVCICVLSSWWTHLLLIPVHQLQILWLPMIAFTIVTDQM